MTAAAAAKADLVVPDLTAAFVGRALAGSSIPQPAVDLVLGRLESDGIW